MLIFVILSDDTNSQPYNVKGANYVDINNVHKILQSLRFARRKVVDLKGVANSGTIHQCIQFGFSLLIDTLLESRLDVLSFTNVT